MNAYAQIPEYVSTDGLVAWYSFNGNANDESGNGNDGVVVNATPFQNRLGEDNSAFFFDGDGYIEIESLNNLAYYPITYSAWVLDSTEVLDSTYYHARTIIGREESGFYHQGAVCYYNEPNAEVFNQLNYYIGNPATPDFPVAQHPYALGSWMHIVFSLTSSGDFTWFVNGELTNSGVLLVEQYVELPFKIGSSNNRFFWRGLIDDCGVWSRTLSESEILALFHAGQQVHGCTDSGACNFNVEATADDGTCIPSGCMDPGACNFNPFAECPGAACQYTCCPGPGCCLDGTVWDPELGGCIVMESWCAQDIDDDGFIGANDLLQLLSLFGTECEGTPDEVIDNWMCGTHLNYQGYSYSTVQIGEQCWFSENLRAGSFRNGVPITFVGSSNDWGISSSRYCYWENDPEHASQHGNLYNWFAATDENGLCPTSWHVPSDEEWATLEGYIGVPEEELFATGWRGTSQGASLLSASELGTDDFGFNALISGVRCGTGIFCGPSSTGFWTSSAKDYQDGWARTLDLSESRILRNHDDWKKNGNSIRCIQD